MKNYGIILLGIFGIFYSCSKDPESKGPEGRLIFRFVFDSTQQRLNNLGQPAPMPSGNAGQNPKMNVMSAHYLELAPAATTALGNGAILYKASETAAGGNTAIDFSKAVLKGNDGVFLEVPLSDVAPGTYEYLRVSLAYQNFDVNLYMDTVINISGVGNINIKQDFPATVASFVGYNTYITDLMVKNQSLHVNGNRKQGFWGFEMSSTIAGKPFNVIDSGQAPAGATTVVNPIWNTSPIPAGSCVVTGAFANKLVISGNETNDIYIDVKLSTQKSFEWTDGNNNGKWEPSKGEKIVDMGLRGMIPVVR